MAHSQKWAAGKYSLGLCDICSMRYKLHELRGTTVRGKSTGLLACPTCWDKDHEQIFLDRYVVADAQALRRARPDTGLQASRTLYPAGNWINGQPPTPAQQRAMALRQNNKENGP